MVCATEGHQANAVGINRVLLAAARYGNVRKRMKMIVYCPSRRCEWRRHSAAASFRNRREVRQSAV